VEITTTNYIRYCKFFGHHNSLRHLTSKFKSKELSKISKYLKEEYTLLPSEVVTASVMTFILLFIPLLIIISQINTLLTLILPIIIAFLGASRILNQPVNSYKQIQYALLQYSDLAFQDLLLILNTTNSVFDAIHFVAEAQYPILSQKFREMIYKLNRYGLSPEHLINEYVHTLPNGNLKERLISLTATKFQPSKIQSQLESLAGEKKFEYSTVTQDLESKLTILVGICLFIPILIALFISFLGTASNYIAVAMVPFFIFTVSNISLPLLFLNPFYCFQIIL